MFASIAVILLVAAFAWHGCLGDAAGYAVLALSLSLGSYFYLRQRVLYGYEPLIWFISAAIGIAVFANPIATIALSMVFAGLVSLFKVMIRRACFWRARR